MDLESVKAEARRRAAQSSPPMTHGAALHLIAAEQGFASYAALRAHLKPDPGAGAERGLLEDLLRLPLRSPLPGDTDLVALSLGWRFIGVKLARPAAWTRPNGWGELDLADGLCLDQQRLEGIRQRAARRGLLEPRGGAPYVALALDERGEISLMTLHRAFRDGTLSRG